jgi:hypothetical protein
MVDQLQECINVRTQQYNGVSPAKRNREHYSMIVWLTNIRNYLRFFDYTTVTCMEFRYEERGPRNGIPTHTMTIRIEYAAAGEPPKVATFDNHARPGALPLVNLAPAGGKQRKTRKRKNKKRKTRRNRK